MLQKLVGPLVIAASLWAAFPASAQEPPKIPMCPGLTVVTAISQKLGDYESIKRIESVTAEKVRLHYSSEHPPPIDLLSDVQSTATVHFAVDRVLRQTDLKSARAYMQQFVGSLPEEMAGTTSIGTCADVIQELRTKGESFLISFLAIPSNATTNPLERLPGTLDYRIGGVIKRVEPDQVFLPVIVNDRRVNLPTIHARGLLTVDQGDFYFLDDPDNPIALRFTIGRDHLNVIRITFPQVGPTGAASGQAPQIEQALESSRRAEVYGIYFEFGSDALRKESEPVLEQIAHILTKNPTWKLNVEGHTDNVGTDSYNLDLSKRRAASVKTALVKHFHIAEDRLVSSGFGASQPREPNDSLNGRARNRRVELVRR
jgi:hypothetical protein